VLKYISLLDNVYVRESVNGRWTWKLELNDEYYVKDVYRLLTNISNVEPSPFHDIIRNGDSVENSTFFLEIFEQAF